MTERQLPGDRNYRETRLRKARDTLLLFSPFEHTARRLLMAWSVILRSRLRNLYGDGSVVDAFGAKMSLDFREIHDVRMYWSITHQGGYEPETSQLLGLLLRPGDTFVDIGANNGYFAILASRYVGREGRVLAVEPNPLAVERLKRNVDLNGLNDSVRILPLALGEVDEETDLYVSKFEDGWASVIPFAGAREPFRVRVARLDNLLESGAASLVLKLDAEGAEISILRGMAKLLEHTQNLAIILEWNHLFGTRSAWDFLRSRFQVFRILSGARDGEVRLRRVRRWDELRTVFLENLLVTSGPRWEAQILVGRDRRE